MFDLVISARVFFKLCTRNIQFFFLKKKPKKKQTIGIFMLSKAMFCKLKSGNDQREKKPNMFRDIVFIKHV